MELKLNNDINSLKYKEVLIVLYGIETAGSARSIHRLILVLIVLYGIETYGDALEYDEQTQS